MAMYVLYESSSGYALFDVHGVGEIGQNVEDVRSSVSDLSQFRQIVKLTAFHPFQTAQDALKQVNAISEGFMSDELRSFLDLNLPKVKEGEEPKFSLGVSDPKLGSCIFEATKIPCQSNEFVQEILRGVRQHFDSFINDFKPGGLEEAQHGLAHNYSKAKVKSKDTLEYHKVITSIGLLDTLDEEISTCTTTTREWYSWHFPELENIVNDSYMCAQVSTLVEDKSKLSEEHVPMLTEVLGDEDKAREVVMAGQTSMGQDLRPLDLINVQTFSQKLISLTDYRKKIYDYLVVKMNNIAPNLAALIGEMVAARLISHVGSLRNLAKLPSSTLQILGAEKALLRALRTGGKGPKHGLIFHSSFISRASARNKGRIARYLASKCSMAARVDYFGESSGSDFGEKLREQIEERLESYEMNEVLESDEENAIALDVLESDEENGIALDVLESDEENDEEIDDDSEEEIDED